MATKVFDVFIEGKKVATGTIEELMDIFKVSKKSSFTLDKKWKK